MLAVIDQWFQHFKQYAWAAEVIVVISLTILLAFLQALFHRKVTPTLKQKKKYWESGIVAALHKPLRWFIWIVGISFAFDIAAAYSGDAVIFHIIPVARKVIVVLLLVWFMLSFIKEIEKILLIPKEDQRRLDKTTIRAVGQVLRVTVLVTSLVVILQSTMGVGASAILAFIGGGSITIGFAAKDMLANFFGGLMIFLDRPFAIGERIRSEDGKMEGSVEEIGWRLTNIITNDKVPLYVPNAYFLNMNVQNLSRMSHRRILTTVGIRYEDIKKIPIIVNDVHDMLRRHEEIDSSQAVVVRFNAFSPSSVDFIVSAFTYTIDWAEYNRVLEDVLLKIVEIVEKREAGFPFPTSTIHIPEGIALQGFKKGSEF